MLRVLPIAGFAAAMLGLTGCAGTLDAITSRKFRKDPFNTMYRVAVPEDPLVVLRSDPPRTGDEQAKAMLRLKEPLAMGLTQQDQDQMVDLLARTATKDPSPVLRVAAVEALGRFQDQRVAGILMTAYRNAHGRPEGTPEPSRMESDIQLAGGMERRRPGRLASLVPFSGPVGFSPETADVIRSRTLEALGKTSRPEAARFLAAVATGDASAEGADDRDVRLAAVRGLGKCRQPEAVAALAQVLAAEKEKGKDTAIVGRAHDGLVHLTGKRLPPDPKKWDEVVQAGVTIAPEPTWVDNAVQTAVGWVKK